MAHNPIANLGKYAHPKGGGKSKGGSIMPYSEYRKTARDKRENRIGEKETGMTPAQYERSARDKREDALGMKQMSKGMKKGK